MRYMAAVVVVVYVVAVAVWVFGVLAAERADPYASNDVAPVVWLGAHVALGVVIGRWWALALAAVPAVCLVVAGDAPTYSDTPLSIVAVFWTPILDAAIALGVLVRKAFTRRQLDEEASVSRAPDRATRAETPSES